MPRLHAKIFEHPEGFATVGSQNITQGGMHNREATVVIRDGLLLEKLRRQLDRWVDYRRPISIEMITEAEKLVAELIQPFQILRRKCLRIERTVFASEWKREVAANEEYERRQEQRHEEDARVEAFRENYWRQRGDGFKKLGDDGRVSYEACRFVAWNSMRWWNGRRLARAHRDANHLEDGTQGWTIRLGGNAANGFGVEYAIRLCRDKLQEMFPENTPRCWDSFTDEERAALESCVQHSIINHRGAVFPSYPMKNECLWLGSHGVHPPSVINAILHYAGFVNT